MHCLNIKKKLKNIFLKNRVFSDGFFGDRGNDFHTRPDPDQPSGFSVFGDFGVGDFGVGFFRGFSGSGRVGFSGIGFFAHP